ncbi:suppressor of fused domain protein [Vibrio sp. S4M6]|uniref:suppressor of fused domain protein n=1 Tax=Vibrio sinus TaxID=2946865 RepID=UPI00202AA1AA|nr:suppressor of fused domain protein [Vibrio sinus]MCL9780965.1 suppressor of fused domain protein [Vibrio sinus]
MTNIHEDLSLSLNEQVLNHYCDFFQGHEHEIFSWYAGPVLEAIPQFRVFRASPGSEIDLWVYGTIGVSSIEHPDSGRLEFVMLSDEENPRCVELLAMVAYYHQTRNVKLGFSLSIGQPWISNSMCDHLLLSLPYPFGPDLEICNLKDGHAHVYWLLPITENESAYKVKHGLDALEGIFEEQELSYWEVDRKSVV